MVVKLGTWWSPSLYLCLRWLGEWLLARLPAEPGAGGGPPARSFEELSRVEKMEVAFSHLDRDLSG